MTGEPALVDLDEESDSEEQDFDSWKPDPIDADPSKTARGLASLLLMLFQPIFQLRLPEVDRHLI